ncbi:MAG: alpha-L-rhamnosidase C-terminal domain-containing protein [Cyclobacteriaceae bacterium]|nr:alpha-L-rhamnosidase C-terminal domain-containing protein [Cyclobacteriaceae bacterium]
MGSDWPLNIKKAVKTHCWDEEKQLFRDFPNQQVFSQHSNILAILCDVIPEKDQTALLERILTYDKFDEYASSYFSFYLFKAMDKTNQQDEFMKHLDFWYTFLDRGHTTAGETGFASHDRSDCHAWAAHPSYYLLSLVCGIKPADIGFNTVNITPYTGNLESVEASMPHPKGRIEVNYRMKKNKLTGKVILPPGLSGQGFFNGKTMLLHAGENVID